MTVALQTIHSRVLDCDVCPDDVPEWAPAVATGQLPGLTADQAWKVLLRWWGSHERAHVFADWFREGVIDAVTARAPLEDPILHGRLLILEVWSDLKAGGARVTEWLRLFKATGFVSDGASAPTEPVTVYRGHGLGRWWGLSWTTDLDCAHGFADWFDDHYGVAQIFKAELPPDAVLARYDDRNESEVIVNPYMLRTHVKWLGKPDLEAVDRWRKRVAEHNTTRRFFLAVA